MWVGIIVMSESFFYDVSELKDMKLVNSMGILADELGSADAINL